MASSISNRQPAAGVEPAATFVEHARRYSELGWALVRVEGKKPKGDGWQQTQPDRDTEHAAGKWATWGSRWNMGVVLGPSRLAVVEYDTDHAGQKLLELLVGSLPETPVALTGSGRHHLYFHAPDNAEKAARDGLELRVGAHMCVLPPSVHPTTSKVYRWMGGLEPWAMPLGPVPAAVLAYFTETRRNGRAEPVADVIPERSRRTTLLSLAGSMRRRGMTADEMLAALLAVNEKRCQPPLETQEVDELARDVAQRYSPEVSIPPPIASKAGGNETESSAGIAPVLLESLLEHVPEEPSWVLRGYVAPFALTLTAGRPKVGKSTLIFALLARLVVGAPFAGVETVPAGVLVLTEERQDTLAEKARIFGLTSFRHGASPIGGGNKKPVHVLMRHDAGALAWPEIVRQAMAYCHQQGLGVLVVDTFDRWTNLRGDSENAAGATNEALEPLQYAAASGLAVVIVSHQRKSAGEYGEAVRGSNALTGGVDIVVELERPAATLALGKHARVLRAVSRFISTPDELYLELDEQTSEFVAIDSPEEVKAEADRAKVAETLAELGDATSNTVAEQIGFPDATVRRHLNTLLERGQVARDGEGKRGDPFRWRTVSDRNAA
jgi:hypothetical protein